MKQNNFRDVGLGFYALSRYGPLDLPTLKILSG